MNLPGPGPADGSAAALKRTDPDRPRQNVHLRCVKDHKTDSELCTSGCCAIIISAPGGACMLRNTPVLMPGIWLCRIESESEKETKVG